MMNPARMLPVSENVEPELGWVNLSMLVIRRIIKRVTALSLRKMNTRIYLFLEEVMV
jgi:hypothetical protein